MANVRLIFGRFMLILSVLGVLLCAGCTSVFFQPMKEHVPNPALSAFSPEDVYFTTPDGIKLHGLFIKARGEQRGSILFLHGNAENVSTHTTAVLWLAASGYDVFAPDYRGYGKSGGSPSVTGVHRDAEAALDTLVKRPETAGKPLFVLGQSIGGAIAITVAAHSRHRSAIRAVIADSPFSSYRRIAREKLSQIALTWPLQYPLAWLLIDDEFSPIKHVRELAPVPLVLIHMTDDPVVPSHHSSLLYETAGLERQLWPVQGTGHIAAMTRADVRERLLDYLGRFRP